MPHDPLEILKFVTGGSVAGILFYFIYGGMKKERWWVYATYHVEVVTILKERIADRDEIIKEHKQEIAELKKIAYKSLEIAQSSQSSVQKAGTP